MHKADTGGLSRHGIARYGLEVSSASRCCTCRAVAARLSPSGRAVYGPAGSAVSGGPLCKEILHSTLRDVPTHLVLDAASLAVLDLLCASGVSRCRVVRVLCPEAARWAKFSRALRMGAACVRGLALFATFLGTFSNQFSFRQVSETAERRTCVFPINFARRAQRALAS